MSSVTETVKSQYEDLPYPHRDPEEEKQGFRIVTLECPDIVNHLCFGGAKDFTKPMRILIAGGGTGDSTVFWAEMLREYPESEIIYIDLSSASRKIAEQRLEIRGLKGRVKFLTDSIYNIPTMDIGKFDIINCSGVLHHLENPEAGLAALSTVLKDDGIMILMLYGKYGRLAVYPMQEMMRLVNSYTDDKQEKIKNTLAMIKSMPQENIIAKLLKLLPGIFQNDAELYDIILHSQDRAYSVPEVYDFAKSSNLQIIEFCERITGSTRGDYSPEKYIADPELLEIIKKLSRPEKQAIAEVLNSQMIKHQFYLSRKITPEPELSLDVIPSFCMTLPADMNTYLASLVKNANGDMVMLTFNGIRIDFLKYPHLEKIIKNIDGKRTLRQIFKNVAPDGNPARLIMEFRNAYNALHNHYLMFLRNAGIPQYPNPTDIMVRVKKMYGN